MNSLIDAISRWITEQVARAGAKGVVVGLSGGIDSTVTAALCQRALGEHVLGVIMPCESAPSDEEDARAVAAWLGLKTTTVILDGIYRALLEAMPPLTSSARANIKPRLRMTTLYALANSLGYLVAGTGNRSEIMIGYFTKHGDGAVDILPIGGLLKREVRGLAVALGVPERIITKPPTAGLWPGQTDEGEMGISYEELDAALDAIAHNRAAASHISGHGLSETVMAKVRGMVERSEHKRRPAPIFQPG